MQVSASPPVSWNRRSPCVITPSGRAKSLPKQRGPVRRAVTPSKPGRSRSYLRTTAPHIHVTLCGGASRVPPHARLGTAFAKSWGHRTEPRAVQGGPGVLSQGRKVACTANNTVWKFLKRSCIPSLIFMNTNAPRSRLSGGLIFRSHGEDRARSSLFLELTWLSTLSVGTLERSSYSSRFLPGTPSSQGPTAPVCHGHSGRHREARCCAQ